MENTNMLKMAGKFIKAVTFMMIALVLAIAGMSIAHGFQLSGTVTTNNGTTDLEDVNVSAYSLPGNVFFNSTLSLFDGTYSINDLNGWYNITYTKLGFKSASEIIPFNITTGGDVVNDVNLANLSWVPSENLTVHVKTSVGANLIGAQVVIMQGTNVIASGDTDTNGNFIRNGIGPGPFTITVSKTDFTTNSSSVNIPVSTNYIHNVTLTSTDTLAPTPVTFLSHTPYPTSIIWRWVRPTEADFDHYMVEVFKDSIGGTLVASELSYNTETYTTGTLSPSTTYYIRVTVYDYTGNPDSSTSSATTAPQTQTYTGGGSSYTGTYIIPAPSYDHIIIDFAEADSYTRTIGKGDIIRFVHNQKTYYLSVPSFSSTKANFRIMPSQMFLQYDVADTKNLSIDGDEIFDFILSLDNIDFETQRITLTLSKYKTDAEPEQATITPAEPESTIKVIANTLVKRPSPQKGILVSAAVAVIIFLLYLLFFVWI